MTDTDNEDKLRQIARKLLSDTEDRKVEWSQTDDAEAFEYSLRYSSVVIDTTARRSPQPYWMSVFNSRGVIVGKFEAAEPDDPWATTPTSNPSDYALLRDLWAAARDSALKIGETLTSVLDELDGLIIDPDEF